MITLPTNWKTYSHAVRDRCRDLITYKIWEGIDINRFYMWRKNFKTDEEKFFASCILDSLVYRSNTQTFSLINQLLFRDINNLLKIIDLKLPNDFPYNITSDNIDPQIRLVPVISQDDPVTKSSNEVLRFMKRYFRISEKWIINPWNIEHHIDIGAKAIIFIDDFLGTGSQFENVCIKNNINQEILSKTNIIYAPLVAHEDGINHLKLQIPGLKIICTEVLKSSLHSFFRNYFPNSPQNTDNEENAKNFYKQILDKNNIQTSKFSTFGYGNLELTYAFEHAAPDNSLHILFYKNDMWNPLFNR